MGKIIPASTIVKFPKLHPSQQMIYDDQTRFIVVAAGRRFGKSLLARIKVLDLAINHGKQVWFVSPTYNNVMVHWRETKNMMGDLPTYRNEQQKYMEFERSDGRIGTLSFKSGASPDNLLGSGLDYVVVDEAAYQLSELWYRVLRPSLSDRQGGAMFISTPNGVANWFYSIYMNGQDDQQPDWRSYRFRSIDNPMMLETEIAQAKNDLPELRFRQEYLAEFVSDAGGVFRKLEDAAVLDPIDGPIMGHQYVAGVDWGRKNDFTVVSIFDMLTGDQVSIERFTEIGWEIQLHRIRQLNERWGFVKMYIEANSAGGPMVEELQKTLDNITPVTMTNPTKVLLVERLAAAIEKGHIKLLSMKHKVGELQISELQAYSMERSRSGMTITYNAPKGAHDDIVVATMLANMGLYRRTQLSLRAYPNPFYGGRKVNNAKSNDVSSA